MGSMAMLQRLGRWKQFGDKAPSPPSAMASSSSSSSINKKAIVLASRLCQQQRRFVTVASGTWISDSRLQNGYSGTSFFALITQEYSGLTSITTSSPMGIPAAVSLVFLENSPEKLHPTRTMLIPIPTTSCSPFHPVGLTGVLSEPRTTTTTAMRGKVSLHHSCLVGGCPTWGSMGTSVRWFSTKKRGTKETFSKPEAKSTDEQILDLFYQGEFKKMVVQFAEVLELTNETLEKETFHTIVRHCSNTKDKHTNMRSEEYAVVARMVIRWLIKFHCAGRLHWREEPSIFGMSLSCWVNCDHPAPGEKAETFLNEIEEMFKLPGLRHLRLNSHMYQFVMEAYARTGQVENVQAMWDRMMKDYESGNGDAYPDQHCWCTLLNAHAKSGNKNSGETAEGILDEMVESYKRGLLVDPPNDFCYHCVIHAYAKASQPEKAEAILERQYKDFEHGNKSAQPNPVSFNSVLDAWAKKGSIDGARRAEAILKHMIKLHYEPSFQSLRPNFMSYNTVIASYSKVGVPLEAERILNEMHGDFLRGNEDARPTMSSFNSVMSAWARSRDPIAGTRCEHIFDLIARLRKDGTLKEAPHARDYNTLMDGCAAIGNWEKTHFHFKRMVEQYTKGDERLKPDVFAISILLKAAFRSGEAMAGNRADVALKAMDDFGITPNIIVYGAALQCYRATGNKERIAYFERKVKELSRKK